MTIRENVAMGLRRIKTMTEGEIQHRVSASLYLVDLVGSEDVRPVRAVGG
jgi:ABC-type Fe3+/spermidine/putrescine transport system ATPase subunit